MTDRNLIKNLQLSNKSYLYRGNNVFVKYSPEITSKRINTDSTNLDVLFKQVHSGNERTNVESPTIFRKTELQSNTKISDEENKYGSNYNMLKLAKSVPSIITLSEPNRDNNHVLGFKASSKFLNSKINDIDLRSSSYSSFADKLEKKRALWKSEHRLRELTQDILKKKKEIKTREFLTIKQPNETSHYNFENLSRYRTSPVINNKHHHFFTELNEPPTTIVVSQKLDAAVPSSIPTRPSINSAGQVQSKKSILKNPLPIENQGKDNYSEKNSPNKNMKRNNIFDSTKYNAFVNTQHNSITANITVPVKQWRDDEIKSDEMNLIHSEKTYERIKQPQDELSSAPSEHSKLHQSLNTVFEMQNKRIQKAVNYLSMPEMKFSTGKKINDARKKSNELKKGNNNVYGVKGKMNVAQGSVFNGIQKEDFGELNFDDGHLSGTTHSNLQGESNGASRCQIVLPSSIDNFNIGSFDDEIGLNKQSKKSKETYMQELNDEEDGKKSIHSKLEIILKEKITTINGKMREKKPTINQQFFSNNSITADELKLLEKDDLTKKSTDITQFSLAAEQNLISSNTEKKFENHSSYRNTFNSSDFEQFLREKKKAPTPYQTLRLSVGDKEELIKRETLINEIKAAVLSRSTENLSKKSPETYTPHKLLTNVDFIDYTKSDTNIHEKISDNKEDFHDFKVQKNLGEHNISNKDVFNISEDFLPIREQKSKLDLNSPGLLLKVENLPLQSQSPAPIRRELNSPITVNPLVPNHDGNVSPLLANKKLKKTDLRPINKNAVAEMLNFHLWDKNGWDRLDETRRFLTEKAVSESALINEERNNINNLPFFQDEIFQIRNNRSSSPRKFSLTDSEFEIGRQISLGELNPAKHIQKGNDENEKNNVDTENDISENIFEATWLSSLENESNHYKNTETEVSTSSSLNEKISKKVKPRIIGEIKRIEMENLHSESAFKDNNKIFKMNRLSIPKVLGHEVDKDNESSFNFNKHLENNESVKSPFNEKKLVSGINKSIVQYIGVDMLSSQTTNKNAISPQYIGVDLLSSQTTNKNAISPRDTPSHATSPRGTPSHTTSTRGSTDVKWSNENYLAVNIGKINIPKNFLERNSEESTADDQKYPPQIGNDLFEKKTTILTTDSSLNNHAWLTPKQTTPRKLSIRLKQLFSPTHKRKNSLLNSDDDIARRKNINKTGAFGFENESPLNQSEDDIDEDFISNEEWKGMNDSWKSRARKENVFNLDSLRSKDDLDGFSIKKQPKIRKPLTTNTFSQKIRKDKFSTTIPITFVDKSKNEVER